MRLPRRITALCLLLPLALALAAQAGYRIGAGDRLKVLVLGQPELSGEFVVGADGAVAFPFVGSLVAQGLDLAAFEDALEARLADGYLKRPQVAVTVQSSQQRRVFVSGEVKRPGPYSLRPDASLRQLLDDVGELGADVGHEVVIVRPPRVPQGEPKADDGAGTPLRSDLPGDVPGAEVRRVSLRDLLAGQPAADVRLEPGDSVHFPKAAHVYVIGHAVRPGAFKYEPGLTVHRLLALAGGTSERGSSKVKIARLVDGRRRERRAEPSDVVEPEDTLIVPERFF